MFSDLKIVVREHPGSDGGGVTTSVLIRRRFSFSFFLKTK
jgi:hypothetical protein